MKARIRIVGWLPERALTRLNRVGIALYSVKRKSKEEVWVSVDEKDAERVLALYPKTDGYTSFWAERLPAAGLRKRINEWKPRAGLALGLALFLAVTLFADGRVLAVKIDGETPYQKEIADVLEECGVSLFRRFPERNADLITSRILALDGVAFSSVKKVGATLLVEVRHGSFVSEAAARNALVATADGVVEEVFALRGALAVAVGQEVKRGETLVSAETVAGQTLCPVAYARLSCVFEETLQADTKEGALAQALLRIGAEEETVRVQGIQIEETENGFRARIAYALALAVNYGENK